MANYSKPIISVLDLNSDIIATSQHGDSASDEGIAQDDIFGQISGLFF